MKRALLVVFVVGCKGVLVQREAGVTADADAVASAALETPGTSTPVATVDPEMETWKAKIRKACGLKPDAVIFPKTKRAMLEDCNEQIAKGLPNATFPPLPEDVDRKGLSTTDGCRYFVDSFVDTQGVRARFRCKYDPSVLGHAEWQKL